MMALTRHVANCMVVVRWSLVSWALHVLLVVVLYGGGYRGLP